MLRNRILTTLALAALLHLGFALPAAAQTAPHPQALAPASWVTGWLDALWTDLVELLSAPSSDSGPTAVYAREGGDMDPNGQPSAFPDGDGSGLPLLDAGAPVDG